MPLPQPTYPAPLTLSLGRKRRNAAAFGGKPSQPGALSSACARVHTHPGAARPHARRAHMHIHMPAAARVQEPPHICSTCAHPCTRTLTRVHLAANTRTVHTHAASVSRCTCARGACAHRAVHVHTLHDAPCTLLHLCCSMHTR